MLGRIPQVLLVRIGWTTASFGVAQFLRLLNNVLLARLLAPSLLGLMLIVNALRTAAELFSDIGLNQSIVRSERGEDPEFYNTTWTLQLIRGILLGLLAFALSGVVADLFDQPELARIMPVVALIFLLGGFESTGRGLLQKRMAVQRLGTFEVSVAALSLIAHVALALITPTIWALVLGSVIAGAATLIGTYLLIPGLRHRLLLHRASISEILGFGRWIFLSSIIYFLAMNFDRLYFAKQISLTELGVFGIARTLAEVVSTLAARGGHALLFPLVAALSIPAPELRQRLRRGRRTLLLAAAVAVAGFVATSDVVIAILYDARYEGAGYLLPLLLIGVWFAILCATKEFVLLGMGKAGKAAFANGAKLAALVIGIPVAFGMYGFIAAVLVLSMSELVKYVALWIVSRRAEVGFVRDDIILTIIFLASVVAIRSLLSALGLTGTLAELFPILVTGLA